jgi:hypothetical protein
MGVEFQRRSGTQLFHEMIEPFPKIYPIMRVRSGTIMVQYSPAGILVSKKSTKTPEPASKTINRPAIFWGAFFEDPKHRPSQPWSRSISLDRRLSFLPCDITKPPFAEMDPTKEGSSKHSKWYPVPKGLTSAYGIQITIHRCFKSLLGGANSVG